MLIPLAGEDTQLNPALNGVDGTHAKQLTRLLRPDVALVGAAERPDNGVKLDSRIGMTRTHLLQLAHNGTQIQAHLTLLSATPTTGFSPGYIVGEDCQNCQRRRRAQAAMALISSGVVRQQPPMRRAPRSYHRGAQAAKVPKSPAPDQLLSSA